MQSKWLSLTAATLIGAVAVGFTLDVSNPLLKSHVDALKGAPSITLSFTYNKLGSEVEDQKLVLSKPNLLRWETPATITVADGTTVKVFDRKAGTYYEDPETPERLAEIFNSDVVWAWTAVLNDKFLKPITDAKTGATRRVKNNGVKELVVARDKRIVTILVDDKLGFARGVTFQTEGNGEPVTHLVVASDIQVGKEPLAASDSAFTLPASAKKVEKSATADLTFKDVKPILQASCACHFSSKSGGLGMTSYQALMAGGRSGPAIVPGDPDSSLMMMLIRGQKAPKMPPQGNLPAAKVDQLAAWIKAGAKE